MPDTQTRPAPLGPRMAETLRRLARSPEHAETLAPDYSARMTVHRLHQRGLIDLHGSPAQAWVQITDAGRAALAVHDGEGA